MNLFNNTKREGKDMEMFISQQEARMEKVVRNIERWLLNLEMAKSVNIYFNNQCWAYDHKGNKTIKQDVKGSEYFEYANDDTISMSFDGGSLYEALNNHYGFGLSDSFAQIDFDGMYYELGHSWNLSFVD